MNADERDGLAGELRWSSFNLGTELRHEPHHSPQKSSTTTCPFRSANVRFLPSSQCEIVSGGAGWPTFTSGCFSSTHQHLACVVIKQLLIVGKRQLEEALLKLRLVVDQRAVPDLSTVHGNRILSLAGANFLPLFLAELRGDGVEPPIFRGGFRRIERATPLSSFTSCVVAMKRGSILSKSAFGLSAAAIS